MTLREMLIHSIVEFEMVGRESPIPTNYFEKMNDSELMKIYRNIVWDEAYTDGHVEGYFKGVDYERVQSRKIDPRAILN